MEAGYRVTAFDFRGHGESGKPHDPQSYGLKMLTDTVAVMDAAGIKDACVMGYSMGAWQSIVLMMHYPERVRRAVLGGVGEHYFRGAVAGPVKEAIMAEDISQLSDPTAIQFYKFLHRSGKDALALRACIQGVRPAFSCDELGTLAQQILVVDGDRDDVAGRPEPLAQCFPHARALLLPGKDHMSAVGDKEHKRAVLDFFSQ